MTLEEKMERQDASIKKMAKALKEGAKMLDLACPVCNNPVFQVKSGEKMCIVCDRKVVFEGEMREKSNDRAIPPINSAAPQQGSSKKNSLVQEGSSSQSVSTILSSLRDCCVDKLASLVQKMVRTTDEGELSIVYANVLKVLEILNQLHFI